jgi:hypothetical protein
MEQWHLSEEDFLSQFQMFAFGWRPNHYALMGQTLDKEGAKTQVFDPISYVKSQCLRLTMPIRHKNVLVCLL